MLVLLFLEPDGQPPTARDDLVAALGAEGVALDGADGDAYRPGRWRDADTGAWCHVDVGEAPIEEDELHPPTRYAGWREIGLTLQIPLSGAHWRCADCGAFVERLLRRLPDVRALDTEDTRATPDAEPGPSAFDRLRLLASWERLHAAQYDAASGARLPRMDRAMSLALWRYRRERAAGQRAEAGLRWPDALALLDGGAARSAALWEDPSIPLALPPVELLVVPRAGEPGALPADEAAVAGAATPLPLAGARRLAAGDRVGDLWRRAKLMPAARFRALGDDDWSD